ncbi:hypothetical protein [Leyella stercorea]|uniref:hypothetical protein n=1 Tax=Leyella stercorea TaxID=363265 RepID=UPI003A907F88
MKEYINRHIKNIVVILLFLLSRPISANDIIKVVCQPNEYNLTAENIVTIPFNGVFVKVDNQLLSLCEHTKIDNIILEDGCHVDDVVWSGKDLLIKSGNKLLSMNKDFRPIAVLPLDSFMMYGLDSLSILISREVADTSFVFTYNLKTRKALPFYKIEEKIVNIFVFGNDNIFITYKNIYISNKRNIWKNLGYYEPILSAVYTRKGLIFASRNSVCRLTEMGVVEPLSSEGALKLLYDGINLFILANDGALLEYNLDNI